MEKSLVSSRWLNIFLLFWFRCHQLCIICVIYMRRKKMKRNADQIFNKYCKLLYKISIIMLCSEEDAYDAVQESFLKYLNTKKDFNDESHERAWLTRVNINICKNILRFRRMHPTVDYETLALHYHKPEETGIMDTLMTLNAKDKEVLILYYIEGYSCKEIADMLKVSESAVKKKLERARKRLKEKYESEGR